MKLAGQIYPPLLLGVTLLLLASVSPGWADGRIVAVGDIHGELEGLKAILREARIIDAGGRWIGGETTFVQTGDFLDRGKDVRSVMDLLMALEQEAPKHGGKVWILLGNHEVMNLLHIDRDVNLEAYAAFAEGRSEERRRAAYDDYVKYWSRRARQRGLRTEELAPEDRDRWLAAHPPGKLEYQAALGRKGRYGRWLRKCQVAVKLDGVVFMHSGPGPEVGDASLKTINGRIRREVSDFDRARARLVANGVLLPFFDLQEISLALREEAQLLTGDMTGDMLRSIRSPREEVRHREALSELATMNEWWSLLPEGPLWFRGFATWHEEEGRERVDALLERHRARHLVIAHSGGASKGQIALRFAGKVIMIDTGMLASHFRQGRPAALEVRDGTFTAIYQGSRVRLEPPAPTSSGAPAPPSP
jgi:hypothetical protein